MSACILAAGLATILGFSPPVSPRVTSELRLRNLVSLRAGDGIRTRDVQLGKLAFYP